MKSGRHDVATKEQGDRRRSGRRRILHLSTITREVGIRRVISGMGMVISGDEEDIDDDEMSNG